MGLGQRLRNHHALACSQAIGFDDNGGADTLHMGVGQGGVREGLKLCGRNAVSLHESLGESFGALELSGCLGGPDNSEPGIAKDVHNPLREWALGAHHGQVNGMFDGPVL